MSDWGRKRGEPGSDRAGGDRFFFGYDSALDEIADAAGHKRTLLR